MQLVKSR